MWQFLFRTSTIRAAIFVVGFGAFNFQLEHGTSSAVNDDRLKAYLVDKVGVGPTSPGGFMPAFLNATCPYN